MCLKGAKQIVTGEDDVLLKLVRGKGSILGTKKAVRARREPTLVYWCTTGNISYMVMCLLMDGLCDLSRLPSSPPTTPHTLHGRCPVFISLLLPLQPFEWYRYEEGGARRERLHPGAALPLPQPTPRDTVLHRGHSPTL